MDMKRDARPSAYMRQVRNEWVSSESKFIDAEMYDRCVDPEARPCLMDTGLVVFAGLDASLRHDSTALVAVTYDVKEQRVRLVAHKLFRPHGEDIDFAEVENAVLDLRQRFAVRSVSYDPYQLEGSAQRLRTKGIPMVALDQTSGNLTAAADRLFELFQGRNIALYPDPDVREAVLNASVKETSRGYRLTKERPSKKIDLCAALSFAALTAIGELGGKVEEYKYQPVRTAPSVRDLAGQSSWATNPLNPNVNLGRIAEMEDAQSSIGGMRSRRFPGRGTW
jgi:phage terminase large subunit-like protein